MITASRPYLAIQPFIVCNTCSTLRSIALKWRSVKIGAIGSCAMMVPNTELRTPSLSMRSRAQVASLILKRESKQELSLKAMNNTPLPIPSCQEIATNIHISICEYKTILSAYTKYSIALVHQNLFFASMFSWSWPTEYPHIALPRNCTKYAHLHGWMQNYSKCLYNV